MTLFVLLFAARAFEPLNLALMDLRFRLLECPPSDTLVIVEIDPQSLRQEERWPWPRDRYARAVENLQNAGARLVAFDVDFSALSDQPGDDAFAAALSRRPGEVVLPVFWQWSSRSATDGEVLRTPPNDKFLNDAVIASVTLVAEKNGVVRRGWYGIQDGDDYRASLASVLAGAPHGAADAFYIDYAIDPSGIERLSFHDVLTGQFPADAVRGKNILIGATALELGDEFAAPVYGVTPGVVFHALSYESMMSGRALTRPHEGLSLILGAAVLFWLAFMGRRWKWRTIGFTHAGLGVAAIGAPVLIQAYSAISFDTGAILVAQLISAIYVIGVRLERYARQIIKQRAATAHYQALTSLVVRDNADGVIVANASGRIDLCNDRARALLGVDVADIIGENIRDFAPDFPLVDIAAIATMAPSADGLDVLSQTAEYAVPGQNDLTLEIVSSCSSHFEDEKKENGLDAGSHVFVYTLRDISARKRIEAAEKEAKDAAIAANAIKSQLIANMSHELRTPLNGVIGFADILKKEAFGPLGVDEYKDYAESIYDSGVRLLSVFNDMLHIAKLDSGDFELCTSEALLDETVESCVFKFENQAEKDGKALQMRVQRGVTVEIDISVFREILSHLLSNALKYTDSGGSIIVRASEEGDSLVLEVQDDGCGVAPDCLSKLTEAFYQADGALNRKHEGAGLGLYVVSKFVELHGGVLSFGSEPGKGFVARVEFRDVVRGAAASSAA